MGLDDEETLPKILSKLKHPASTTTTFSNKDPLSLLNLQSDMEDPRRFGVVSYSGFREIVQEQIQSMRFLRPDDVANGEGNADAPPHQRYCAVLCLAEGEHFRRALHLLKRYRDEISQPLNLLQSSTAFSPAISAPSSNMTLTFSSASRAQLPGISSALWAIGDGVSPTSATALLGSTGRYRFLSAPQHRVMIDSYRFLDNSLDISDQDITVLLRVLEKSSCADRAAWWTDIRACRRRKQVPLEGSGASVEAIFSTTDEYEYMEYKAIIGRVRSGLKERGMLVFDAFRAFNSSHSGVLSCSELYGGLDWLGLHLKPPQVN